MRTRRTVSRIRKKARFARIALLAAVLLLLGCVAVDSAAHLPCVKVLQTAADRLPNGPMGVKVWGLMIASGLLALFVFGPGKGKGESGVEFTDVYRCFFEENPSANIILGSDGIIKELNKSGLTALGHAERSQLIRRSILDLVAPEHKARLTQLLKNCSQEVPGKAKVDLLIGDGSTRTFLFSPCRVTSSDTNSPADVLVAGVDVTHCESAGEDELRPAQQLEFLSETAEGFLELSSQDDVHHYIGERLRQLVSDAAYIVVNSIDREQRKLQVRCVLGSNKLLELAAKAIGRNPAGMSFDVHDEAWQGLAGGRLVKVPGGLYALAFGQLPKAACSAIEKLANPGDIHVMGFAKKGEVYGSAAIVLRRGVQLTNQTVIETFIRQAGVALQRRQAEEALQREREKLELATENSGVGLAIISKDYRTLWANQVLKRMFGDVEGKLCYQTYNQRSEVCPECGVRELFQTGKDQAVHEQVGKDKEGKTIWSQIIVTPVRDTQGNLTAALEAAVPITERKQNEILQTVLYRIANAASTARDLEELFRIIRKELMSVLDTTNFFVALYDRETGSLSLPYHVDQKDKFSSFPPGRTLTAWILRNDSPLLCTPEVRKRLLEAGEIEPTGALSVAWLGVPLKVDSETIGVLGVQSYDDASAYGARELEILQFASEQIAVVIRRKQAEEALRRSERDYRGLFEGAHDAIVIFEPETETVLDVNRRACEIYGFKRSEFLGMSLKSISQNVPKGEQHIRLTLEKGSYHRFQTVQYRKDGTRMFLEVNASVVDYMGQRVILSINRDVTERKQAEQALREGEERFRRLSEAAFEAIAIHEGGVVLTANDQYFEMFQYEPNQLLGKQVLPLTVAPEARESMRKQIAAGGLGPYESIGLRKDGSKFPMEIRVREMEYEGRTVRVGAIMDITERKQAEEVLKKEKERYRNLFETAPDSITTLDTRGFIVSCNIATERLAGYSPGELVGKHFTKLGVVRAKDLPRFLKLFGSIIRGKVPEPVEVAVLCKDGTVRQLETHISLLREDGKIAGVQVISRDITERRRAAEALRLSERRYRQLFQQNLAAVYQTTLDGTIVDCNPSFARLLGYQSVEQVLTKNASEFYFSQSDRQEFLSRLQKESSLTDFEYRLRRRDGKPVWILENVSLVEAAGAGAPVIQGTSIDITERKRAEDLLRTSEAQLSNAMQIAQLGYWEYDVAKDLFTFNDHFYAIFRTSADRVGGYTMTSARYAELFVHPDDQWMVGQEIQKALETTDPRYSRQLEHRIIYADGQTGYIAVRFFVVKDDRNRTIRTYGANQDITERKRAGEALRESEERYRTYVENAPDGIFITDSDARYIDVNRAACRMTGYSRNELLNMSIMQLAAAGAPPESPQSFEELKRKGRIHSDIAIQRKDGSLMDASLDAVALSDGRYMAFCSDITERKRAEEALRESQERYRTLFEKTANPILVIDDGGNYIDGNQAALDFLEWTRDELLSRNIRDTIPPGRERQTLDAHLPLWENGGVVETDYYVREAVKILELTITPARWRDRRVIFGVGKDITERKRAEEALRENQAKLQSIFSTVPAGIGMTIDQTVKELNTHLCEMTGYSEAELFGRSISVVYPSDQDYRSTRHEIYRQLAQKGSCTIETCWRRRDDRLIHVLLNCAPIKPGDLSQGITFAALDITEHRQAEENLKEAYDIINRSPTVAFLWRNDEKWSVEFVSNNVRELFGYTAEEFISGRVYYASLVHPDDLARVADEVDDYSREQGREDFVHRPYRIVTKDGEVKWIDDRTHIRRDKDGRITHYQGVVEDITERKAAEEALRESEKRIRTLADASFEAIMIHEDGTLLQANDQFFKMFGYGRDELLGRNVIPLLIAPESVDLIRSKIVSGSTEIYEVVVIKKDGTTFPTEIQGRPVEYHARRVRVASMRDLSGRKKMEAQLIQAERLAAVGTLAYGIAHEFNNIVAGILGNAEFGMGSDDPKEVEECFRVIMENCDRARSITNHLLAFVGQRKAKKEMTDLVDTMENVLGLIERELQKENINVKPDFNPVPEIFCDPGELSEVYLNMMTNARDAMRPQGGTLTVSIGQKGDRLMISFADTGCGIPDEIKARIFEPFVTTKGALGQSEIPGTGLGLFLSIGIVTRYRGSIEVESREGRGSTFTISLPISQNQNPPEEVQAVEKESVSLPPNLRILLVDDEEPICTATKNGLEADGHSVVSTTSGEKGLELFRAGAFDLVLSDITMPDMDGLQLMSTFKAEDPQVKLIAVTGHVQQDKLAAAKKAGADQILIKPFKKEDLLRAMNRVLTSGD